MMEPIEVARAELVAHGGNAFAVAAHGDGTVILGLPARPLTRKEVANLSAWLTIVANLTNADILPILRQQGYVLLQDERPGTTGTK